MTDTVIRASDLAWYINARHPQPKTPAPPQQGQPVTIQIAGMAIHLRQL